MQEAEVTFAFRVPTETPTPNNVRMVMVLPVDSLAKASAQVAAMLGQ